MRLLPILFASLAISQPVSAGINFQVTFEEGSKWFTESWSATARAEMLAFFADLGAMFDSDATVRVAINDNETNAYASAGSTWYQWHAKPEIGGMVSAPGLWLIVVKGIHNPSAASDVTINWNLDANSFYGGNASAMIGNFRGLGRHEMHHAFGSVSSIYMDTSDDPRGQETFATLLDTFYRDQNGNPLLGAAISPGFTYTLNNFPLAANWATASNQSGLYFEGRDSQGRVVKMPPISGGGYIDFSHVTGISYVTDHVNWSTYNANDFAFLRALGYPLKMDSALVSQGAQKTAFDFSGANASLTVNSSAGKHYRLATSVDLRQWKVMPVGTPGTGSSLGFTYPIDKATEPKRFFQVVEVSE